MAFVLPLLARKFKGGRRKTKAAPLILVLVPSRELARQVGREWERYSKQATNCVTVFGGVPIERHAAFLRKHKPQVLISTPGRLRELHREGHVEFSQIQTIVLDEADTLLDQGDSPDVRAILEDVETAIDKEREDAEYQMVLVSATMNEHVTEFTQEVVIPPEAMIQVQGSDESKTAAVKLFPKLPPPFDLSLIHILTLPTTPYV